MSEYTAHIASGSMEFADGVRLVKKRGKYMQEEVPVGKGAMAAIIAFPQRTLSLAAKRRQSRYLFTCKL